MPNRLATEQSPYLLQHKDNPVDWLPWGDEAFERARAGDKPIFLSVGYSTCHWCHVMEHESFEQPGVADVLNRHFVSIKVDREERPDVDRVYMTFVQATTGSGGWPMSVWLTPALEPFYGGTYFPPTSRWGRPGFVEILEEIARVWREERDKVARSAATIVGRLRAVNESGRGGAAVEVPGTEALDAGVQQFAASFDRRRGGFGDAPKFPRPSELLFLLREHARTGASAPRDMALVTLRAMALGGMRDHLGGGFHRYSVDGDWRVPHFEKMLYDQAQLVLAYVEAAQVTGEAFYADVAADTLAYVMRDLVDEGGGFYSAEDADSIPPEALHREIRETREESHREIREVREKANREGGEIREKNRSLDLPDLPELPVKLRKMEGAFYIWRDEEIGEALGEDAGVFRLRFGVQPDGNAPFDPQSEFTHKNLLYTARSIDEIASMTGRPADEIAAALSRARRTLFDIRARRPRPHLDDKVLTAWNGLLIAALARASRVLPDGRPYLEAARRAAGFIRGRMWDGKTLLRRYRGSGRYQGSGIGDRGSEDGQSGHSAIPGFAEDYAYLIFGLLEVFQADGDLPWLSWALDLQRRQDELFWDEAEGGWFSTTGADPSVLLRMKEEQDGAEPSASSVSGLNLLTIAHLTGDAAAGERVERTLARFAPRLSELGRAVPMMLAALSTYHSETPQIVIVGPPDREDVQAMLDAVRSRYLPGAVTVRVAPERQSQFAEVLPWVASMRMRDGRATAYVCRGFACQAPTTDPAALTTSLTAGT